MALPTTLAPNDLGHINDHEEIHVLLDDINGLWNVARFQQGLFAARPAAGRADSYYWATDVGTAGVLYRDNGATWTAVGPGPGAAGYPLGVADTEADGTSDFWARADHVHGVGTLTTIATLQADLVADKIARLVVPACRAQKSVAQTIASGTTWVDVTFDDETGNIVYDNDSMHSTSVNTERFSFTRDGFFTAIFNAHFDTGAGAGQRGARIVKMPSGDIVGALDRSVSAGGDDWLSVSGDAEGEIGDYLVAQVFHTDGSPLDLLADSATNFCMKFFCDE